VYIPNWPSTALTEWSVTEKEIQIKSLSQFIFHKKPISILTGKIFRNTKYQPERNFNSFKLKLHDGTIIKFWHNNSTIYDDDFDAFLSYFEK